MDSLCPHCHAQVQIENNDRPVPCPSCGQVVNGPAWFYAKNRQKLGPVSLTHLQQSATSGDLQTSDMVLQDGAKQWVKAGTIPQLFPAHDTAPTEEHLPAPVPVAESITACNAAHYPIANPVAAEPLPAPTERIG